MGGVLEVINNKGVKLIDCYDYKKMSKEKESTKLLRMVLSIRNNLSVFSILGFTSVCIFTSFTYNALNYTQVINASLFNTAIPVTIILVCFLLKIEKTNIFQIIGVILSFTGVLVIMTKANIEILRKKRQLEAA